jgi:hypothetical protein
MLEMLYENVKSLNDAHFLRLVGVRHCAFATMIEYLATAKSQQHFHGGRKPKLSIENMLLMSLMYLRENRTYFHIAKSYGVSESSCWQAVRWVENTLIKSGIFSLPGKKQLLQSAVKFEVILIDASETPIERPKKAAKILFRQEKAACAEITTGC